MSHPRMVWFATAMFVVFLTACAGGGGSSSPGAGVLPTQPPATTNSATIALQAQATSVPLPPIGSYTGMMSMPPGSGTLTVTSMMQPPAGIPTPTGFTPMMYVTFTASAGPVSISQTPGFNMDMMSSGMMGSSSYYMAQYMNGSWSTVEGPAMMSGATMMMNSSTMPVSLQPGQQICFAYYSGAPVGSASPSPSAMPSMMP